MRRFSGKAAVVTGGAQGIGLACARRFLDEGGRVLVADIRAEADAGAVSALGGRADLRYVRTDATERAEVDRRIAAKKRNQPWLQPRKAARALRPALRALLAWDVAGREGRPPDGAVHG